MAEEETCRVVPAPITFCGSPPVVSAAAGGSHSFIRCYSQAPLCSLSTALRITEEKWTPFLDHQTISPSFLNTHSHDHSLELITNISVTLHKLSFKSLIL